MIMFSFLTFLILVPPFPAPLLEKATLKSKISTTLNKINKSKELIK